VAIHEDDAGKLGRFSLNTIITRSVSPKPERLLVDGDEIEVGELRFKVLHTPGHTPGGICIYGQGVVLTGDTLFRRSIGRTDMPRGSHSELLRSIQSNLLVLPDETVVLPGHGASSTIGEERRENPFLVKL
jgi:hydroxyacylglutathione hydrolase